jgi:hypothetical protein
MRKPVSQTRERLDSDRRRQETIEKVGLYIERMPEVVAVKALVSPSGMVETPRLQAKKRVP